MLNSAYIDPKRIEQVEAVAEMIWRGLYDLRMGHRLIAEPRSSRSSSSWQRNPWGITAAK